MMKRSYKYPEIKIAVFDEISCATVSDSSGGSGGGTDSGTNLGQAESSLGGNVTKQNISTLQFK